MKTTGNSQGLQPYSWGMPKPKEEGFEVFLYHFVHNALILLTVIFALFAITTACFLPGSGSVFFVPGS